MRNILRILTVVLGVVFCSPVLHGLYNAQGVRQQVASVSEVFTTILDVNFSVIDAQLSVIETQNVAMRSLLDGADSQLEVLGSKIDTDDTGIASQLDVIESKIDAPSCAPTPITTTTTISTSGAYCLANNITGGLSITGTSITLDLAGFTISGGTYGITISGNDVTVRNGTIKNASIANILLTGNQCLLQSCDLIGSAVGLQMLNASRNRITDCCAMNNTQAGFSLVQSFSNSVVNCQALATTGTTDFSYGFVADSGGQNVFEQCTAEGTISSGFGAFGFGMLSEVGDVLLGNNVLSTLATTSSCYAYGMLTNGNAGSLVASTNYDTTVRSVQWSPDGHYLASGGSYNASSNQIQVYAFNGSFLTTVTSVYFGLNANIISVDWSPNGQFLAIGGIPVASENAVRVYAFDGSSLVLTASQTYGTGVASVNWSPDGQFLAVGGLGATSGNQIQVYKFVDYSALITVTGQVYGTTVYSVDWSPNGQFLAVGGDTPTSGNEIQVYAFNSSASSLVLTTSQDSGNFVISVDWSPNGQYLAVVGWSGQLQVYSFDGSFLTLTVNQALGGLLQAVNWSPDGRYVAVAIFSLFDGYPVKVYEFKNGLTLVAQCPTVINAYAVDWSPNGWYLASGFQAEGWSTDGIKVFGGFKSSSQCILQDNLVSGAHNAAGSGVGYCVNACTNLFMGNTAYANDSNYLFTTSCTGDNIYSQLDVIESKIDASGAPVISQLSSIESKLGVCCTALDSQIDRLESKLDTADAYIISKLALPSCAPTVITTTTTISTSGAYCLAQNITGGLSITGTSITLDLSGRTISGGTYGITISGDDVTVRNGTIKNATSANILLTGNQCLIESCDVIGSITGIQLNNATRNRLSACCAINNSAAGFSLAQSFSNSVENCQALATVGTSTTYGFVAQNGAQNVFQGCVAQGTQSSAAGVVGFGILGEVGDLISGNNILSTLLTSSVGSAYGLLCSSLSSSCVIENNLVDNTHTSSQYGIGYSIDACKNLFVGNTAYANDTDNQFITSCMGDNIYSQLDVIEGKLTSGIQSITTAGTIAVPGSYCLANNISGDLVITATNVTLDLNGYTINSTTTGITVTGNNVVIKNGIILGGSRAGIWLNGTAGCDISGITCSGATYYGFILTNSANGNSFNQCNAVNITFVGYLLYQAHGNTLSECAARMIGIAGFGCLYAHYNTLSSCASLNIYGAAVTNPTPPGAGYPFDGRGIGIEVFSSTGVIVDSCQVENIKSLSYQGVGIDMPGSTACVVNNCSVVNVWNGSINNLGIALATGSGNIVTYNTVNMRNSIGAGGIVRQADITNSVFSNNSVLNAVNPWWIVPGFISGTIVGIDNVPTPG